MSSDGDIASNGTCTTVVKQKRKRRTPLISMAATQNCIADAMAKIISNMENPILKMECAQMLQAYSFEEVQGKILQLLQEIDFNILQEQELKELEKKKRAAKKKRDAKKNSQ